MISVPRWAVIAAFAFAAAICVNAAITYSLINRVTPKSFPSAPPDTGYAVGYATPSITSAMGYLILKWRAAGGILYHVRTTTIGQMANGTIQPLDPNVPEPPFALAPGDATSNVLSLEAGQQSANLKFLVAAIRYSDDNLKPHVAVACMTRRGSAYKEASANLTSFNPLLASLSRRLGFVTRCS